MAQNLVFKDNSNGDKWHKVQFLKIILTGTNGTFIPKNGTFIAKNGTFFPMRHGKKYILFTSTVNTQVTHLVCVL
jgi:hypothetical protein